MTSLIGWSCATTQTNVSVKRSQERSSTSRPSRPNRLRSPWVMTMSMSPPSNREKLGPKTFSTMSLSWGARALNMRTTFGKYTWTQ